MFEVIAPVIVPVFVTALIGYVASRRGYRLDGKELSVIIADVATPCLIVNTFQTTRISFDNLVAMAGATATAIALFAAIGTLLLSLLGLRIRTFLPSLSFANGGNLGLPIALYAFGTEGLGYAIAFFATSFVANCTFGQTIAAGRANWGALVRQPLLYAVALGVFLSFTGLELPRWAKSTVGLIGSMTVPLMLLMLGSSLGLLRVASLKRALLVSIIRIVMGASVGLAVAALFGFTGAMRAVLVLQCANPVAVYNYLFAQRWNNQPEEVAGVVVISTLLSTLTIPLLLGWLVQTTP